MTRDPLITIYYFALGGNSGEEDDREVRAAKVTKSQLRTDSDGNLCCDDVDRELGPGFTRIFLRFNEAKAALKKHWKTSMEWARYGYRSAMLCRKPKDPPVVEPSEEM